MRPDRLLQRLPCLVGRHRRSRSQAVRGKGASGGSTYLSVCRHCGIPMERLHHGRWIVSPEEEASGRGVSRMRVLGLVAAAVVLVAAAGLFWGVLPAGSDSTGESNDSVGLAPNDQRLLFSHFAGELIRNPDSARIVRPIDTTDQGDTSGLKYAAPGARVSLTIVQKAPAPVSFNLFFDGFMTRADTYNGAGVVLVDGVVAARYDMPLRGSEIPTGEIAVSANVPAGRHVVSLVLPYAASVAITGVTVPAAASVTTGPPPPKRRVVLLGDSRLNGAGAADITGTIAFQLAQRLNAEVINLANGGRQLAASDFAMAGELAPDLAYSLYDYNNFYSNSETLQGFGAAYAAALREFVTASAGAGKPEARLLVITSFASSSDADFTPPGPFARNSPSLEAFRRQERTEVAALGNPRVRIVEGRGRSMPGAAAPDSLDGVHFSSAAQAEQAAVLAAAAR